MVVIWPHPALSKGEGSKNCEAKVLSFGEDLGEATTTVKNYK
jgi:hypothetical protein